MEAVDFSGIARAYRWMEYLSFGPVLHRVRCWRLPQMAQAKRALVLGDGDGRFLAQLQRVNPTIEIDAVDCSPAMVRLAQSRVASGRVHWIVEDARSFAPAGMYDLIVSHFFLDCFSTTDVNRMAQRFSNHMAEGGLWVNSDFHVPPGWARPFAWAIVRCLYLSFRWLTGLKAQQLPQARQALLSAGLMEHDTAWFVFCLLKSEVWQKSGTQSMT